MSADRPTLFDAVDRQLDELDVLPPGTDFLLSAARVARDEALTRVEDHADDNWKGRALEAVHRVALEQHELIANDLWHHVEHPREPRATGPVMMKARKLGWIAPTERYRPVPAVSRHAAPVRIWRSLLWERT